MPPDAYFGSWHGQYPLQTSQTIQYISLALSVQTAAISLAPCLWVPLECGLAQWDRAGLGQLYSQEVTWHGSRAARSMTMRVSQMGQERLEVSGEPCRALSRLIWQQPGGSWLHTPAAKGSGESLEGHHSRGQTAVWGTVKNFTHCGGLLESSRGCAAWGLEGNLVGSVSWVAISVPQVQLQWGLQGSGREVRPWWIWRTKLSFQNAKCRFCTQKKNLLAYEMPCFNDHKAVDEMQLHFKNLLPTLSLM